MERFPKFLKTMPVIYGLSFYEIGALVFALYVAMILNLSSILSLVICLVFIGFTKFIKRNFDLTGFFASKVKTIDLTKLKGVKR